MAGQPLGVGTYTGATVTELDNFVNPVTHNANVTLAGSGTYLIETAQSAITAGTTRTQAGATALTREVNRVDTSTAPTAGTTLGDGVALPVSVAGLDVTVINNTANPIQVYGNGSDTINGVAGSTGIPLPPGDVAHFECALAGAWSVEAGVGSSGQYPVELANDNISAAGANQGAATNLTAVYNRITTATANQGVRLPASAAGMDIFVENHSGVAITVYGASSDTIDDVATATGVTQMDSSVVIYTCYTATKWYSNGLATGYAKNPQSGTVLETMQFADALTATGANQGAALQLAAALNNVTTVASSTGVNLPASAPGLQVTVQNNGANPLQVYPAQSSSDTINGIAAGTGITLHQGVVATFNCTLTGAWTTQPSSPVSDNYTTNSSTGNNTGTAAQFTGGEAMVVLNMTGALGAGANLTTPTAAAWVAALHAPAVGQSYRLRIINSSSGNFAWTVVGNASGVTLTGTATINQNTWREYNIKVTAVGTPAVTMQNVGTGTWS